MDVALKPVAFLVHGLGFAPVPGCYTKESRV